MPSGCAKRSSTRETLKVKIPEPGGSALLENCAATCPPASKRYYFIMNADCTVQAPATHRIRHTIALRLQCRKEWVEGQGTLAQIAKRHGVPEQTLIAWYRRENWTASRNRWLAKQLSDNETPAKPPSYAPNPKITTSAHAEMLQRLELQLSALDNALDNATSPDDWSKLTTAKHRLLENYYILAGIPKPGSRRPGKERPQPPTFELPQPLDIAPLGVAAKPTLNPAA